MEELSKEEINRCDDSGQAETFTSLGVADVLCKACKKLKWEVPTAIQKEAIPAALKGRDIIGLAETGSGKTGAFAIPILEALLRNKQRLFALVLVPTRELADQVSGQFEILGAEIGIQTATIVGGTSVMDQCVSLSKKPHIIIATPGRLVDHLENMRSFNLRSLKYLVMDEADRILDMDFEPEVNRILRAIPKERHTYLYSATMTKKVQKLQRASLNNPVRIEVSKKYQLVETLVHYVLPVQLEHKDAYLVHVLNELQGKSCIIFCATCANTQKIALMLRHLKFSAVPLHGKLNQDKRIALLTKFKDKSHSILVATDVASRGLDIPHVDVVINYDVPTHCKDYVHRVGRTARAGRTGMAITIATKFDLVYYSDIEKNVVGKELEVYPVGEEVKMLVDKVAEARRQAKLDLRKREFSKGKDKRQKDKDEDDNDTEEFMGVRNRLKKKQKTR